MSRKLTHAAQLRPPSHARHGGGSSRKLAGHAAGRIAWLPQVQLGRGGSRVLEPTVPGGTL